MMKNITLKSFFNLLLVAVMVSFLTSCANDNALKNAETQEMDRIVQMYDQILAADDFENRKLGFNSLLEDERSKFWLHHVNELVNRSQFTEAQLTFLADTRRVIETASKEEVEIYFESVPEEIFSQDQLLEMFTLTYAQNQADALTAQAEGRAVPWCNCAGAGDCMPIANACAGINCNQHGGCGWLGWWTCDGRCGNIVFVPIGG